MYPQLDKNVQKETSEMDIKRKDDYYGKANFKGEI